MMMKTVQLVVSAAVVRVAFDVLFVNASFQLFLLLDGWLLPLLSIFLSLFYLFRS